MCPSPTFRASTSSNSCVATCAAGFGPQTSDRTCYNCQQTINGCSACANTNGTWTCSQCVAPLPLTNTQKTQCYANCPAGTTLDVVNKVCYQCPANCQSCAFTNGQVVCNACNAGYLITPLQECVLSCKDSAAVGPAYVY